MGLYIVRTAIGREAQVMDFLASNAKKTQGIYSFLFPHGMNGYIIVEASSADIIKHIAIGVPYVRGVLRRETNYAEIEHLIEFKPEQIDIHIGDTVQIIAGPFKGEKARVTRIDLQKTQIVIELLEAAVPIPITLGLDSVKVISKSGQQEEKPKEEVE